MSTTQTTINIPRWLTNGPGWQTSNQGSCQVTVTRNYGDNYATISTYWGYCSPGGSQASVNCIINVNGTVRNEQLFGLTIYNGGVWYYANGSSFTVPVSDSAGSVSISVYMYVNAGSSGQQSSTISGSLNYDSRGETIPTVNKTSADIGTAVTITTQPYASGFSHKLYYSTDGGKSKTSIGTVAAGTTTKSWTIPTSIATKIPSDTSILITIVCETYNGSAKVGGDKICTLTATVPASYKPTISSVSISEATAGLASQFGVYVQTKSTLKIVTSASGSNGSTIKSVSVSCNGFTYSGTTVTTSILTTSGNVSIVITVTDSRGRTASTTKTVNVVAYKPPAITTSTVTRATSAGTASDDGVYALCKYAYNITNVNNKNTHTFKIQYKNGSSWVDMVTYTDYTKSGSYISSKTFSVDNAFDFRFVVTDYFGTYTIEKRMEVSFALFNVGANGHSFMFGGQAADKPGYLGSYLPFAPLGGQCIHNANGTAGSTGYVLIMRLVTSQTYINSPMRFAIIRRGDFMSTDVFLKFANANSVDPTVEKFIARGATRDIYVVKSSTSTFDIYVKKAEAYDTIAITAFERNYGNLGKGVSVSYRNTHAASLPTGYKQADDYRLHDGTFYIGCVITDTTGVNPSTRYGGTWEVFAPGRSLIGAGTGNDGSTSMTFTVNSSGGEFRHRLTINELAKHDHKQQKLEYYVALSTNDTGYGAQPVSIGSNIRPDTENQRISFVGNNEAHNVVHPYKTACFWQRTA